MWTVRNPKIDWPVIEEIEAAGDRACAVLAVSLIEDRLEILIKMFLHYDEKITPDMFSGLGPLASFSAQTRMGFLLGIYGHSMREALSNLGRIRNRFAHELGVNTFDHPSIIGVVKNLAPDSLIQGVRHGKIKRVLAGMSLAVKPVKGRALFIETIKTVLILLECYQTWERESLSPRTPAF